MTRTMCERMRPKLAAFADGELRGRELLAVDKHVPDCAVCGDEVRRLRQLGDMLRAVAAESAVPTDDLAGLADGVISRVRAEERQSWTASMLRGLEDLHWVLAGAGAVVAAIVSAVVVYMVVGGVPTSDTSLAALMHVVPPANLLPAPPVIDSNLIQLVLAVNAGSDDGANTFVTDDGVQRMRVRPRANQRDVETVVGELSRMHLIQDVPGGNGVRALLITSVRVSAL